MASVQILGLRDFVDRKGKSRKTTSFFSQGWRLPSMDDIFVPAKLNEILTKVPDGERFNLYFTVAQCFEEQERELQEQWYIPFDIDGIKFPDESGSGIDSYSRRVLEVVLHSLGVAPNNVAAIFSGHGVQLFVRLSYAIRSKDYFDDMREHYVELCHKITRDLTKSGLTGKADPTVWSHARLMRLPETINKKPDKPNRKAYVLTTNVPEPIGYYLAEHSGLQEFKKADTVPDNVLKQYPRPDSVAVREGCSFLRFCAENPKQISEPQWYAQMSITSRLENGRELTHSLSETHPGYNYDETDNKIDQALKAAGPRTCKDIGQRWDGCSKCPNFGKVTSPIMIRGENYITSKDFGFRKMIYKDGEPPKPGAIAYDDLLKEFGTLAPYISIDNSREIYQFDGKIWRSLSEHRIKEWTTTLVKPSPSVHEMNEFYGRLYTSHVTSADWFSSSREFKMNFQNCVLDLRTMAQEPHRPEHGFLNILSFDYDPLAVAPRWKQYLTDSMDGDAELTQLLEEFGGYALSGDPYPSWGHKALLLEGDGDNGKSIYLDILGDIAGKDSCSSISAGDFEDETARHHLLGRLFNKSEETAKSVFRDSEIFKLMTAGGVITARELYKKRIEFRNTCKIIMSCNTLPYNSDNTHGFARRLIIVPFKIIFAPGHPKRDPQLYQKLQAELPGICNSLIAAYRLAKGQETFIQAKSSVLELERYKVDSDPIRLFLGDTLEILPLSDKSSVPKDEVYREYVDYCKINGYVVRNATHFWRHAAKHIPHCAERSIRPRGTPTRQRVLTGARLLGVDV